MRHLKKGRKFGRERDIRKAMIKSLASSFFLRGRIQTGEAKAKELRPFVEKIITRARTSSLKNRREIEKSFSARITQKIFAESARFGGRSGGYTRIIRMANRKSDNAKTAVLEFADR